MNLGIAAFHSRFEIGENDLAAIEARALRNWPAERRKFPGAARMVKAGATVKARRARSSASAAPSLT
jgi:hypothetical protein